MSKTKEETVQQWRESLAESARTAVEALSAVTPLEGQDPAPSIDEASKILGQALLKIRELVRPTPRTVAFWEELSWYRMEGTLPIKGKPGECHNPFAEIDAVTSNPKMPTVGEIDGAVPHMKFDPPAEKPFTRTSLCDIPQIGIEFKQFYTNEYYHAVCYFHNKEGKQHVYEVTVRPFPNGAGEIGRWHANCLADGETKFILESKSKSCAIECALTAMRRYLIRGHRAAWRTWRRAESARKAESEVVA